MAAMTRTSTGTARAPSSAGTSRVSSTRSSLRLHRQGQLAHLVQEERAALGRLEDAAHARPVAARPNSSRSAFSSVSIAQSTTRKGP